MNLSRLWPLAAFVVLSLVFVLVGLWLRSIYAPEWMVLDTTQQPPAMRPWAVEADCYSQLARVQRILHGQGLIQNHFTVENWPEGLIPSTTAPFDYVILLLYAPLTLFTTHPLDWAGALVSPALWLGLVLFWMIFRSREFTLSGRALFIIGSALLPALILATPFGRPRHLSLNLVLLALGFLAEYERWHIELTPKRAWNIFAGIIWGLACWTSLFEPILVVASLIIFNLVVRRRENFAFLVSFGVVMLVALAIEGVHIFVPPAQYEEPLVRWLGTIGEVQPVTLTSFVQQCTCLSFLVILPFVAWRLMREPGHRQTDLLLILLTVLLLILTFAQRRWMYYANLTELLVIVRYYQIAPKRWTRVLIVVVFLLGAFYDDGVQIHSTMNAPAAQPSLDIARIARSIDGPGGIMAPWWISPGLLYFSGQPIVSGSSHCGISGIVASAQFFSATSWIDAERILKERKVRWIVAWDDQTVYNGAQFVYPLLNNSRLILGQPSYGDDDKEMAERTVAQVLVEDSDLPTWIKLRNVTPQLKLYEYVPDTR